MMSEKGVCGWRDLFKLLELFRQWGRWELISIIDPPICEKKGLERQEAQFKQHVSLFYPFIFVRCLEWRPSTVGSAMLAFAV